jgi:8-oxo-dGTP pyrophosphatase MutT (NUDIX family)
VAELTGESVFPPALWGRSAVTFTPGRAAPEKFYAVVVFAILDGDFVLADIPGRGWCVPSGRPEAGETALETAVRETAEEIGAVLRDPFPVGVYTLTEPDGEVRLVPAFAGRVESLGPLPAGTESRGVRIASRAELPGLYWLWDDLMARMFDYAAAMARRDIHAAGRRDRA